MKKTLIAATNSRPHFRISTSKHTIELGQTTKIMGIVNATPDSFSQDGCLRTNRNLTQSAIRLAKKLIREGADMIDVGGESTRPGATRVAQTEELRRVIPVISQLARGTPVSISVDTYKPSVAQHALDAGASMVNNIMGVRADKKLLQMVRNYNAAIVLMHIQGSPRTMQRRIRYSNLIDEISQSLSNSIQKCLEIGIKSDKIIIDPGIGFGKTVQHNYEIIHRLSELHKLNQPILIGPSRKSFIGKIVNKDVAHRVWGTVASVSASILNGAHIVRVHDVKAIKDTCLVSDAILNYTNITIQ